MRDFDTTKAAGIAKFPGIFLKDILNVLAKLVTDICYLSVSLNQFPGAFKLASLLNAITFEGHWKGLLQQTT